MDQHCKYCHQPRKPRKDRPGKFFTMCDDHYAEYMRQKGKESYARHREKRAKEKRDFRAANPGYAMEVYNRWSSKPANHERKKAYMRLYNSPYRIHIKDACEICGYASVYDDRRDLDVHHLDHNHHNNDPANLQTLCVPCHRGVDHRAFVV
jgi:sRNA-binding protein